MECCSLTKRQAKRYGFGTLRFGTSRRKGKLIYLKSERPVRFIGLRVPKVAERHFFEFSRVLPLAWLTTRRIVHSTRFGSALVKGSGSNVLFALQDGVNVI